MRSDFWGTGLKKQLFVLLCGASVMADEGCPDLAEANRLLWQELEHVQLENALLKRAMPWWRELLESSGATGRTVDLVVSPSPLAAIADRSAAGEQSALSSRVPAARRLLESDGLASPCSADEIESVVAAGSKATAAGPIKSMVAFAPL
jgi:hypothetical protein